MQKYNFLAVLIFSLATAHAMNNEIKKPGLTEVLEAASYELSTKMAFEIFKNKSPEEKKMVVAALNMKYKRDPMQIEYDILENQDPKKAKL